LLQSFGLDRSLIRSAAERNPEKWGKFTVGSWIPIVSEGEARKSLDSFLILPWHLLAEIRERDFEWLARGGTLVAPLSSTKPACALCLPAPDRSTPCFQLHSRFESLDVRAASRR
jgi:hypothetical protein